MTLEWDKMPVCLSSSLSTLCLKMPSLWDYWRKGTLKHYLFSLWVRQVGSNIAQWCKWLFMLYAVPCLVTLLCPTLCVPVDCSPPGSSVHTDSPGENTGVGCHALLQEIFPTQESNPGLPALQTDSLPFETPGKPKNSRVGSLSLLQGNFSILKLNWGLLHCWRILYQLSY